MMRRRYLYTVILAAFITISFMVKSFGEAEGAAKKIVVTEEGKHGPVTFAFIIEEGRIKDMAVLESLEVKGQKINQKRFLRQFIGKDSSHPLRVGIDIHALTGATVSSETAARAARKALDIWEGR